MSKNAMGKSNGISRKNVIDEGTTFKGSLTSKSTVVVIGVMEGEISGPAVEVEETGVIQGRAKVGELRSRGELAGEFEAEKIELSGRVRDQTVIRTQSLLVNPKADGSESTIFGECNIEVGDVPSKEQTLRELQEAENPAPVAIETSPSESVEDQTDQAAITGSALASASGSIPVAASSTSDSTPITADATSAARRQPPPVPPPRRDPLSTEVIERRIRRLQAEKQTSGN